MFHTNEGHAGFLGLERIREYIDAGLEFDTALEKAAPARCSPPTPRCPAGIDRFPRDLIVDQFRALRRVPLDRDPRLGAEDYDGGDPSVFNMAVMGFRLGQRANGVSVLHGEVSREMFQGLWSAFDTTEVPISSITNGVHHPTWVHRDLLELLEAPARDRRRRGRLRLGRPAPGRRGDDLEPQAQDAQRAIDMTPGAAGREQRQPRLRHRLGRRACWTPT